MRKTHSTTATERDACSALSRVWRRQRRRCQPVRGRHAAVAALVLTSSMVEPSVAAAAAAASAGSVRRSMSLISTFSSLDLIRQQVMYSSRAGSTGAALDGNKVGLVIPRNPRLAEILFAKNERTFEPRHPLQRARLSRGTCTHKQMMSAMAQISSVAADAEPVSHGGGDQVETPPLPYLLVETEVHDLSAIAGTASSAVTGTAPAAVPAPAATAETPNAESHGNDGSEDSDGTCPQLDLIQRHPDLFEKEVRIGWPPRTAPSSGRLIAAAG